MTEKLFPSMIDLRLFTPGLALPITRDKRQATIKDLIASGKFPRYYSLQKSGDFLDQDFET